MKTLRQNWLLIALVVSSGLAGFWPSQLPIDPFPLSLFGLRTLVALTMFCLGLVVEREELKELKEHPGAVFLGVAVQCTLMPALAWLAVSLLGLEGDLARGVVLVGCVPGAMASNVLTMTARGNVSYSVSLTAVATLLSPVSVPLALAVVGHFAADDSALTPAQLNPLQQSVMLLGTVVLPVLLGFLLKEFWRPLATNARRFAPLIASIALLWIIASVVAGNRQRLAQIDGIMLLALLAMNLLGYGGGIGAGVLAKLPVSMRRALALEVGMQNAGLGTFLAALLYGENSLALIPTAAYTFGCMLTGTSPVFGLGERHPSPD